MVYNFFGPSIGKFEFFQESYDFDISTSAILTPVEFGSCEFVRDNVSAKVDERYLERLGGLDSFISNSRCLIDKNATLALELGQQNYQGLVGNLIYCAEEEQDVECAPFEEIARLKEENLLRSLVLKIETMINLNEKEDMVGQRYDLFIAQPGHYEEVFLKTNKFVNGKDTVGLVKSSDGEINFLSYKESVIWDQSDKKLEFTDPVT